MIMRRRIKHDWTPRKGGNTQTPQPSNNKSHRTQVGQGSQVDPARKLGPPPLSPNTALVLPPSGDGLARTLVFERERVARRCLSLLVVLNGERGKGGTG